MGLISSLLILYVSYIFFKKAAGTLSFSQPNMISYVFYYNLFLQSWISSVLVTTVIVNHYVIRTVSSEAVFYGWLAVQYVMVMLPVGMLFAKLVVTREKTKNIYHEYVNKPVYQSRSYGVSLKYSLYCFSLLSLLSCLYVFKSIGYIPLIKLFTSSGVEQAYLRGDVSRNFSGNIYIRNQLALGLMPLLSYAWYVYYRQRRSLFDAVVFYMAIFFSLNILLYNFEKSPVLWYLIGFVFLRAYLGEKITVKKQLIPAAVVILLVVFFYSIRGLDITSLLSWSTGPIGRVILSQSAGLYLSFDIFPSVYNFIGLQSISNALSTIFDLSYGERSARLVMAYFNPAGVDAGTSGVMNSLFVAEAWANFGLLGVIIAPLWVGFLLGLLYMFFLKSKKSPLHLAFFTSYSINSAVTGGFNDYIYSMGTVIDVLLFFSIIFLAQVFLKISNKTTYENNFPPSTPARS